ncbi:MAG: NADH-quinone oxidoreductase subunit J family protein [Candidatus Hodarchaeales archaeon]|jgi:NADH-quinone oxidoreductase subunit J
MNGLEDLIADMDFIIFIIIAVITLILAILTLEVKDLTHAILFLASTFLGIAGLYLLLMAEFLALIQMSVYAGGVIVLFLFALMLTRSEEFMFRGSMNWKTNAFFALILIITFSILTLPISQSFVGGSDFSPLDQISDFPHGIAWIGISLFNYYQVGFLILGLVLIATLLGSIYLVKNEPEDEEVVESSEKTEEVTV